MMRFLFPHVVVKTSSKYNPDIRIIREWRGLKLLVNGSRQSGPYIKKLWEQAFREFRLKQLQNIKSILVLGIGGGTVIELLSTRYPQAAIAAVDIDSTMIAIAKEYFQIDHIPRLRIIRADAKEFSSSQQFDLIIVDLFIGREIPRFVSTTGFYQRLRKMLSPRGALILNYLRELEYQRKSDALLRSLQRIFSDVRDFSIANNRFFFARS